MDDVDFVVYRLVDFSSAGDLQAAPPAATSAAAVGVTWQLRQQLAATDLGDQVDKYSSGGLRCGFNSSIRRLHQLRQQLQQQWVHGDPVAKFSSGVVRCC